MHRVRIEGAIALEHQSSQSGHMRCRDRGAGLCYFRYSGRGGTIVPAMFRHSAKFVQRILQGRQPNDLPIEQPTKFELAVNLRTAKAMGFTIPETFLLRADALLE